MAKEYATQAHIVRLEGKIQEEGRRIKAINNNGELMDELYMGKIL